MTVNYPYPRISSLSDSLINQIAAGEVIERPSSVVKELIENSIDSGATRIEVRIDRGGTEKIIVSDNGYGIYPDDVELAISRHTTSKLYDQEGLNTITSLGFRGEALSSIASVSDFSITSRVGTEDNAIRLVYNPYTLQSRLLPSSANVGTTVEVSKLFQIVPARRKFLRSARTEYLHIKEMIKRLAMSQCDVEFIFYHNNKKVLHCLAIDDDFSERISSIMGASFYENANYVDSSIDGVRLWGWIGNEKTFRNQSDRQYLYLNRRTIKDKHISHAIRKAVDELIHESRFPSYILYVEVDPSGVDINVHPTKQEVRFRSPRTVHDFIHAAIKNTVNAVEENKLNEPNLPKHSIKVTGITDIYGKITPNLHNHQLPDTVLGKPISIIARNILLVNHKDELRIVDFINFKKYYLITTFMAEINSTGVKSRPLLVPVITSIDEKNIDTIMVGKETLMQLGIEIMQSGPSSISIRSIPTLLPELEIHQFIKLFVDKCIPVQEMSSKSWSNLVELLVENSLESGLQNLKLIDIHADLKRFTTLDLPYAQKNCPGYWKTVNEEELKQLINYGKIS